MTATHDRRSDFDVEPDVTPWTERPIVGARRGLPGWGAVLLALAVSVVGAVVDIERAKTPGIIFQGLYLVGCVAAVCWVRRRSIFGPTVQPPLILVIAVPLTVLFVGGAPDGGLTAKALSMATPLINSFPAMALTTGLTVAIGLWRRVNQRNPRANKDRAARAAERRRERAERASRRPAGERGQATRQRSTSTAARRGTPTRGSSTGTDRRGSSGRSATTSRGSTGQRGQQGRTSRESPPARGGRSAPQPRRRRDDEF